MRMLRALKRMTAVTLAATILFVTAGSNIGCFTQTFDVGAGASGAESQEFQQWYALWGLVPITQIEDDVENYTADAQDYTIRTEFTPLDIVIGIFTGFVTIQPKTVTIEK